MSELRDGFTTMIQGMHGAMHPAALPEGFYARGVNISCRRGFIRTRPSFENQSVEEAAFRVGKFQGAGIYSLETGDALFVGVSGHIVQVDLDTLAVTDHGLQMSASASQLYFCQADKYLIIQDGITAPVIYDPDGSPALRHAVPPEVPIGTVMAYGHRRLFVVLKNSGGVDAGARFIAAGDVLQPWNLPTVLRFTEIDVDAEGGTLALPEELGFIFNMAFMQNAGTGSGMGSLIVFARNGASAFAVNAPRTTWADIDISHVLFAGAGMKSPWGVCSRNSDLLFRALDGIRTLGFTSSQISGQASTLSTIPISAEVGEYLDADTEEDLLMSSLAVADNHIVCTTHGAADLTGVRYFGGLVVIDTAVASTFGVASRPMYPGIWTGLRTTQVLGARQNGMRRIFILARTADGENRLYRIGTGSGQDGTQSPMCRCYTRFFSFSNPQLKEFVAAEFWWENILGSLSATMYARPLGAELWIRFTSMTVTAGGLIPQNRRRVRFVPVERDVMDGATQRGQLLGDAFQICLEWNGQATVTHGILYAKTTDDSVALACDLSAAEAETVETENFVALDDFSYEVPT